MAPSRKRTSKRKQPRQGQRLRIPRPRGRRLQRFWRQLLARDTSIAICRWLARLGVAEDDIPDLLQEVLILALSSLHRYDPQRSRFERWLNKITVHTAAHYHDRAFRRRERVGLEEAPEVPDPALDVSDLLQVEEVRTMVLDCLHGLPANLRWVLIAHDFDGIPMKEIAEQLGVALSTAYRHHTAAREALKLILMQRIRAEEAILEGKGSGTYH